VGHHEGPEALVREAELRILGNSTHRYGTGEGSVFVRRCVGMGLHPYVSHARSVMDVVPFMNAHGDVVSFDGRLDNFLELGDQLSLDSTNTSDSAIVLAAFERWGEDSFGQLTGDWAFALWCEREQKLLLARDHAGTRSLYFTHSGRQIQWATYLDTLTTSGAEFEVSRAYAAAYLSGSPVRDLTPYAAIRAVRPGHYVLFQDGRISQRAHWSPLVRTTIRYRVEADYDEHFLSVFGTAITRRTGPGKPVIAQLSGGMDSTSIVCMSDHLRLCVDPQAKILDTISFFDDSEASLDERRHFLITEQHRGKAGIHLEIESSRRTFDPPSELGTYHFPGCDDFSLKLEKSLFTLIWQRGYRSILSGIGGDEVLGGVPNGLPELADYLVSGRLGTLLRRAIAWSLPERTALIGTIYDTARYTTRLYAQNNPKRRPLPAWLSRCMRDSFLELERTIEVVPNRIGVAPHRLENAVTWWHVMETLPHVSPQILFRPEYRYPMLDKDLVEYLFAIPPDQLVQPGRRRAMMRRALRGIVPSAILERRRKAFQLHASLSAIRTAHDKLVKMMSSSLTAEMGFIEVDAFCSALRAATNGDSHWYQAILRTIAYELWLRTHANIGTVPQSRTAPPEFGRTATVARLRTTRT